VILLILVLLVKYVEEEKFNLMLKPIIVKRTVFLNKKTGQASITLPKKEILKLFPGIPKEVRLEIRGIKW